MSHYVTYPAIAILSWWASWGFNSMMGFCQ